MEYRRAKTPGATQFILDYYSSYGNTSSRNHGTTPMKSAIALILGP